MHKKKNLGKIIKKNITIKSTKLNINIGPTINFVDFELIHC